MEEKSKEAQTIKLEQLQALLERVRKGELIEGDRLIIEKLIMMDINLLLLLKKKKTTLKQVKELIFGDEKAKTSKQEKEKNQQHNEAQPQKEEKKKPKAKGHGKHAAAKYTGAEFIECNHQELVWGAACPDKVRRVSSRKEC